MIGRKEVRKKIRVKLYDPLSGVLCKSHCEITDKFIMMHFQSGQIVCPLHDFIRVAGVNLGFATEVHYVGLTKNPNTRPINRKHRGLADTLYIVSNEDSDLFIIVNLFRVYSFASDKEVGMFLPIFKRYD